MIYIDEKAHEAGKEFAKSKRLSFSKIVENYLYKLINKTNE